MSRMMKVGIVAVPLAVTGWLASAAGPPDVSVDVPNADAQSSVVQSAQRTHRDFLEYLNQYEWTPQNRKILIGSYADDVCRMAVAASEPALTALCDEARALR